MAFDRVIGELEWIEITGFGAFFFITKITKSTKEFIRRLASAVTGREVGIQAKRIDFGEANFVNRV